MDYFLANPKPKPLTQDELLELFHESEEKVKAKANGKNQQTKSCGCCSAENTKK